MMMDTKSERTKATRLFLETVFDEIHEEIMVIDPNFSIQDANKTFLECYGLKKKDAVGRKCYEIVARSEGPCDSVGRECPLEKARKTGKRVEVTHFLDSVDGEPKELVRIMYPFSVGGGAPEYFLEISRDVTPYRDLITRLRGSEKRFKAILDTATDAILSIDAHHRIVLFNDAAQRMFGYQRDEVIGKDLNMLIPAQYGDHYRFVKKFMEAETPKTVGHNLSLTGLRKGGEEFPIELGLSYQEMSGNITFTAIIRDVTSQKQMEKKLLRSERLAAVGQAVAHVAHEIKNPLMIIGGFSHQIKRSLMDAKARQKLDMIFDEISRLEKLVQDVGDFTKDCRLVKRPRRNTDSIPSCARTWARSTATRIS
jgi:two-component system sensor kinase FixL